MISIKVVCSSTGKPVAGSRVVIGFEGVFRGISKGHYTDSNGEVDFDNDPGDGVIFVDGTQEFQGRIEGRKLIYLQEVCEIRQTFGELTDTA